MSSQTYMIVVPNPNQANKLWWYAVTEGKAPRPLAPYIPTNPSPTAPPNQGNPGLSAYELAKKYGFQGTEASYVQATFGKKGDTGESAYLLAKRYGYNGTESAFAQALVNAANGVGTGTGTGSGTGADGKSAYQVWRDLGNVGDAQAFINSLKSTVPGPASTVPGPTGKSAYQEWKDAGNNGDASTFLNSLKSTVAGPASTVPGPAGKSTYELAVASGYGGTLTQYLADQKGAKGDTIKPGVLANVPTATPGTVVYFDATSNTWKLLSRLSATNGLGAVAMVDADKDLIGPGNTVKLPAGFSVGSSYYVEFPDANGKNLAVLPNPVPAGLFPTPSNSFFFVGTVTPTPTGNVMLFNFEPSVEETAVPLALKWTNFADWTYGAVPTVAQVKTVFEVGGASTTDFGLYADGDANTDAGLMASPVAKTVGGVPKNVFLQDRGYGGVHGKTFAEWPTSIQSGEFALILETLAGDQAAGGFFFAGTATSFKTVRLYGDNLGYMAFQTGTIANGAVSYVDYKTGFNTTGHQSKYVILVVNIDVDTLKVWYWEYDSTKSMARQRENMPATPTATYVNPTPFPAGSAGYIFQNARVRYIMASYSPNPAVPAPFAGV